jgi:hypothetical protein
MKGLHCNIMGTDCTAGGITSGRRDITLTGDGINGPFEPDESAPELRLEYDLNPQGAMAGQLSVAKVSWLRALGEITLGGCSEFECMSADWASRHQIVNVVARPVDEDGKVKRGGMFGGHYIKTSDSRFPVTSPIPVHDRFEY